MQVEVNPLSLQSIALAADARFGRTELDRDQVWQVILNEPSRILLASHYHGLVDYSMIEVRFRVDGFSVQPFAQPPVIVSTAPSFLRMKVGITHHVEAIIEVWVMESEALGCRYTLTNHDDEPVGLKVELQVDIDRKVQMVNQAIVPLPNGNDEELYMLSAGLFPQIEPMVILEGAHLRDLDKMILSREIVLEPQAPLQFRVIHAGAENKSASFQLAQHWLVREWDAPIAKVEKARSVLPTIETANPEINQAIALSFDQLMQSIVQHNNEPVLDATRSTLPKEGTRQHPVWNMPQVHYLAGLALAYAVPNLSQRIITNVLKSQAQDGAIDIGLTGGEGRLLCPPMLARWVWNTYQITDDMALIRGAFYPLVNFFNRWTAPDVDIDLDNLPEYQDERQTGYVHFPTFALGERWSQNALIQFAETPDVAAHLLGEVHVLIAMAEELGIASHELTNRAEELKQLLDNLWQDDLNRYAYRDRDTDITTHYVEILPESPVQEVIDLNISLEQPSRLVFRLIGGASTPPRGTIVVTGVDYQGGRINETLDFADKNWGYGFGTTLTHAIFTRVDSIETEGISRIFKLAGHTVDYTRLDIHSVLPLIVPTLESERKQALIDWIVDTDHFNRASGLTIVSAQDANYDPSSAQGGGGVWTYWLTLIGEGLITQGQADLARQFLRKLLDTQIQVLKEKGQFFQFYHADKAQGLGVSGSIVGAVPLYLLMRLIGVRISKDRTVYIEPLFGWDEPITWSQHGVTVVRSADGASVTFPSGHYEEVGNSERLQVIVEPQLTDHPSVEIETDA
jgi:hypothetical protein